MRHKFNLDTQELNGFCMLVHAGRAAGKTHLLGDFLRTEAVNGPGRFLNVKGEDGMLTLRGMGLGDCAETVEDYKDFDEAITEYTNANLHAVGVDSLHALVQWVMRKVVGSDRLPQVTSSGPNEWGELHRMMHNLMMRLRRTAKYVMAVCPSDKSVDQLTGKTFITPDLPGREAAGSAGWFDFVGYLEATALAGGKVKRVLRMTPNNSIIVRQRLPKQITTDIEIPDGAGGWKAIKEQIERGWKG